MYISQYKKEDLENFKERELKKIIIEDSQNKLQAKLTAPSVFADPPPFFCCCHM